MTYQPSARIDDLIRDTRSYEFADGLVDLHMSVILVAIGASTALVFSPTVIRLSLWLSATLGSWAKWLVVLIVLFPSLLAIGMRRLVTPARRRWLWRNRGFVEPLPSAVSPKALALATVIVVAGMLVSFFLVRSGKGEPVLLLRMLVASIGWAQGAIMVSVSRTTGLAHYAWLGIAGGLASTTFLFLSLPFGQAWLAFCLLWGLAFAASGLISLRSALLKLRIAGGDD